MSQVDPNFKKALVEEADKSFKSSVLYLSPESAAKLNKVFENEARKHIEDYDSLPPYPAPKGKVWKTDSESKFVLVDDPDRFNEEGLRKVRRKPTNFTPRKKKRKK